MPVRMFDVFYNGLSRAPEGALRRGLRKLSSKVTNFFAKNCYNIMLKDVIFAWAFLSGAARYARFGAMRLRLRVWHNNCIDKEKRL